MKEKICSTLQDIGLIFCVGIIFSIVILLGIQGNQGHSCKQNIDYSNGVLLLIGIICCVLVSFILAKTKNKLMLKLDFLESKLKYVFIIYFIFLMYISYNVFFKPGWDAGIIVATARQMVDGDIQTSYHNYYSQHPNNLLITCIYALVYKVNSCCGVFNGENEIMALVSFLCLLQTITSYLVFWVLKNVMDSRYAVWVIWGVYIVFMGACPWVLVPYSDASGIIIPIAIFALYLKQKKKEKIFNWIGIGCLMFVGWHIKPQTVIIGIAIVLVEIIKCFNQNKLENLLFLTKICLCAVVIGICGSVYENVIIPNSGLELHEEYEVGAEHMFMMGLNSKSSGVYIYEDVAFSLSIATKKERKEANIREAKERIKIMLEEDTFFRHIYKKALVNFDDGTFAWGKEGTFIAKEYENRNEVISPFLKNVIYPSGKFRHYISTFKQMIWLVILVACMGIVVYVRKTSSHKEEIVIMALSVIGVFMFAMLFEARARYLYTYVPFFVILAGIGYCAIQEFIIKKYTSIKESKNNG